MSDGKQRSPLPWTFGGIPERLTYTYPQPDVWEPLYQFQWDYEIEWQSAGRPKITLLRYRSFQKRSSESESAELVEDITEDIPVNQQLLLDICKHAAGVIFAYADLDGDWRLTDRKFVEGCAEAAKKRFSLASIRQMMQVDPNPSLF